KSSLASTRVVPSGPMTVSVTVTVADDAASAAPAAWGIWQRANSAISAGSARRRRRANIQFAHDTWGNLQKRKNANVSKLKRQDARNFKNLLSLADEIFLKKRQFAHNTEKVWFNSK